MKTVDVAAVQMTSTADKQENLATAERLIRQAAERGARLIVLPELFNLLTVHAELVKSAEPIPGPTSEAMSTLARELGVTLLAGSICERTADSDKCYNTSLLFDDRGELLATYRKIHLFDVDLLSGASFRESHHLLPGDRVSHAKSDFACLGQTICYDLRFPELFRRLSEQGVEIVLLPAAFTRETGRAHWEILVRARAIENQAFVIAANQCGRHGPGLVSFGHSAIVDPWGECLAMAGEHEEVIFARLEAQRLRQVRERLPALSHRRLDSPP